MTLNEHLAVPDAQIDLAGAALCLARDEYPHLDVAHYMARLDAHAAAVRRLLSETGHDDPPRGVQGSAVLEALARHLFHTEGFSGNVAEYYDPRNSFLNDVLDRRTGIPITLSIVYLEVGQRLGLSIDPISFPTHFLVRVTVEQLDVVVDPFNRGAVLDHDTLVAHLVPMLGHRHGNSDRNREQAEAWLPSALANVPRREVIARMLRNLKSIYVSKEDWERALRVVDRLLQVNPDLTDEIRNRGQLYALLECPQAAIDDFERYLTLRPDAEDAAQIEARMATLRTRVARLN